MVFNIRHPHIDIAVFMYIDVNVGKIEQTNKDSDSEMEVHVRQ